jgi:hypothetical protein
MVMIGDPLYRPYAREPALRVEDLPQRLWAALDAVPEVGGEPATGGVDAGTAPASAPAEGPGNAADSQGGSGNGR